MIKKEVIYNIFLYVDGGEIYELGIVPHSFSGSDREKRQYLEKRIPQDYLTAQRHSIPENLKVAVPDGSGFETGRVPWEFYFRLAETGQVHSIYEEMFRKVKASQSPFCLSTPVVDGKPFFAKVVWKDKPSIPVKGNLIFSESPDWLTKYFIDGQLHLSKLLNDDFFEAIKLLLNGAFYVSGFKLILSAIDSFAFLQFGDRPDVFKSWVSRFLELQKLGVSAEELWELRNGLVHMTTYDSRKVEAGKTKKVILKFGGIYDREMMALLHDEKYLDIYDFFTNLSSGCQK